MHSGIDAASTPIVTPWQPVSTERIGGRILWHLADPASKKLVPGNSCQSAPVLTRRPGRVSTDQRTPLRQCRHQDFLLTRTFFRPQKTRTSDKQRLN